MTGLSDILKVVTYDQWIDIQWSLNAIEEYKYILQRLKVINTEAELETVLTEIEDNWRASEHRDKYLSLWPYQFDGDLPGAIEEVEKWITYKIQDITRIVTLDKLDAFNDAYAWYLNERYDLLSVDSSFKVDRIASKDYSTDSDYTTTQPDVMIQKFSESLGCPQFLAGEDNTAEMRVFLLRRRRNGIVECSSGIINLDDTTAQINTNEIHCITLEDSRECFNNLREVVRISTSTAMTGRQVNSVRYGNLRNPNIYIEVDTEQVG